MTAVLHVREIRPGRAWCGALDPSDRRFRSPEYVLGAIRDAAASGHAGFDVRPCRTCLETMVAILNQELTPLGDFGLDAATSQKLSAYLEKVTSPLLGRRVRLISTGDSELLDLLFNPRRKPTGSIVAVAEDGGLIVSFDGGDAAGGEGGLGGVCCTLRPERDLWEVLP